MTIACLSGLAAGRQGGREAGTPPLGEREWSSLRGVRCAVIDCVKTSLPWRLMLRTRFQSAVCRWRAMRNKQTQLRYIFPSEGGKVKEKLDVGIKPGFLLYS